MERTIGTLALLLLACVVVLPWFIAREARETLREMETDNEKRKK
ncbi:MAG TPA: hypothetical protein VM577_09715 [Anaerovoracaceae bacterium]|nr:hypothetical protein [Anaerovoracaceae bacterium]